MAAAATVTDDDDHGGGGKAVSTAIDADDVVRWRLLLLPLDLDGLMVNQQFQNGSYSIQINHHHHQQPRIVGVL